MRILFVDGYPDIAEALAELANLLGYDAIPARSHIEAIARAMEHQPEVVFLAAGIDGFAGRDLCRQLKTLPGLAGTRYIAMTGLAAKAVDFEPEMFEAVMVKPVHFESLEAMLNSL